VSLGSALLVFAGFLYPTLYIFTQAPYYRAWAFWGPPAIASRAGMIAVAIIPFITALGMKANMISFITGVGHERLNMFHRWLGYLALFMALVHALPFIVQAAQEGGYEEVKRTFAKNIVFWNGVVSIVLLGWLCIASMPWFRYVLEIIRLGRSDDMLTIT
jgi:predicted ferric reductase